MKASVVTLTLASIAPMTQSKQHDEPMLEGEGRDAYDIRTWRSKLHVETRNGRPMVVIPAHGMHQCIAAAAKYSKRQIPGQGKATWTAKFAGGIMLTEDPALVDHAGVPIDPTKVTHILISANADGVRGSGKRVPRRFPMIPEWQSTFEIYILDPIITENVFHEMVEIAGMFIGIGQFRPQNLGRNGRFKIDKLVWQDNRSIAA